MSDTAALMRRYRGHICKTVDFSNRPPNYPFIGVSFVNLPGEGLVDIREGKMFLRYVPRFSPPLTHKDETKVKGHLKKIFKETGITVLTPTEISSSTQDETSITFFVPDRFRKEFLETIKTLHKQYAQPEIS